MNSSASSLRAENATVVRNGHVLLDSVSCEIRTGEILVVLGPNGSGKSTLVRLLAGESPPDHGMIKLDGQPIDSYSSEQLALRRAVLPQSSPLAFPFAVEEVVMMGRAPHVHGIEMEYDIEIVKQAMRRTDVADLIGRNYLTLSGGEKQRVHLARVMTQLAHNDGPRFLLLDEPVSSLDMEHQHACMKIARELSSQGVGVMAVLHDLNLAAMYADQILILSHGTVAGQGTPTGLLTETMIRKVFAQPVIVMPHPHRDCPLIIAD